jgi:hypothetical protein
LPPVAAEQAAKSLCGLDFGSAIGARRFANLGFGKNIAAEKKLCD